MHSDKVLISEDRDMGKGPRGNQSPHPEALKYLQGQMGINVTMRKRLVQNFGEFCKIFLQVRR